MTRLETTKIPTIASQLQQLRMRWLGHIERRENDTLTKQILYAHAPGRRRPGAWLQDWRMLAVKDLQHFSSPSSHSMNPYDRQFNNMLYTWTRLAQDRSAWRARCDVLPTPHFGKYGLK